jgi:hypothetical protein
MPEAPPIDFDRRARFDALFDRHYPAVRAYVVRRSSRYCSDSTGNCRVAPNPPSRYVSAYPRAYRIQADGHRYPSYRMTLFLTGSRTRSPTRFRARS